MALRIRETLGLSETRILGARRAEETGPFAASFSTMCLCIAFVVLSFAASKVWDIFVKAVVAFLSESRDSPPKALGDLECSCVRENLGVLIPRDLTTLYLVCAALHSNPQLSRPEAPWEGSRSFREGAFSGTFPPPPVRFAPPMSWLKS